MARRGKRASQSETAPAPAQVQDVADEAVAEAEQVEAIDQDERVEAEDVGDGIEAADAPHVHVAPYPAGLIAEALAIAADVCKLESAVGSAWGARLHETANTLRGLTPTSRSSLDAG